MRDGRPEVHLPLAPALPLHTERLLQLGLEEAGFHRIVGRLEARNEGSAGVMERLGMRREAHLVENEWVKGAWESEVVYALLAREWRERQAGG